MSSPPVAVTAEHLLSSSRYRHPGDVIRLISAGMVLACAVAVSWVARRWLLGTAAAVPHDLGSADGVVTGLVQVAFLAAVVVVVAATLRRRRFRLLAGLTAGAVAAAVLAKGIFLLIGGRRPAALTAHLTQGSWLAGAAFPAPALFASAAAVVVGAAPWLSRPWRRAAWLILLLAAVVRILAGTVLPMQLIVALAAGVTVGAAVLVTFGVPDRRIGPDEIAAALRLAGLPVESVRPAEVEAKGSRKFAAVTADGRRLFVKALGSDQRDADLLYRAYRAVRLQNVGDTRPAASLFHAVERQALIGVMAERAGVSAPGVDRIVRAGDTALLVMEWVDGCSLDRLPAGQVGDDLLARLWAEVGKLHRAGIAHRSLRAANVMVSPAGWPRIVDFSFSELAATPRQQDLDVAELLASLATLSGGEVGVVTGRAQEIAGLAARVGRRRRAVPGANAEVGGVTAVNLDVKRAVAHDRDLIIPLILAVVFVILGLLLRALVAPLILIATVVLSFAAALGVSAFFFNHVFGFGGADTTFPLFVFVFLVALGIDYNIFLMTRVREEAIKRDARHGAIVGLAATGGVITSAGFVLAATFAVLATIPATFLTELGFAVAFGILLDTIVVRLLLVTALNLDVGRWMWWPSKLAAKPDPAPDELSRERAAVTVAS